MSDDQKNIDLILLTIGVLIGVTVGLFVIARDMSNETMARMEMNDPAIQAAVNERIAPAGRVVLDGETVEDEADVAAVVGAEAAPAMMTGPQVYNAACIACHGGGIAGAPKTGDKAAWSARIAAGMDTLNANAINGIQGTAGYMPPKGGRADLSDEEIILAVEYLVDQAQ
ncbi:MAG: c-type cytochrome [Gammaproteobacteria bacterium]